MQLNDLRQLTTYKIDEAKQAALKRVERHNGEKPKREQFQRELGQIWTVLDTLAVLVFVVAFIISSIHIITHVGVLAVNAYSTLTRIAVGIQIDQSWFVGLHQLLMIPLAEGSMILFLVMFGISAKPKPILQPGEKAKFELNWRRWTYLALAVGALLFVANANLSSGMGWLESVLPPFFTVGIGLKLEHLIVKKMRRDDEVTKRYNHALSIWEAATADPTQHPKYLPFLRNEIWKALMALKTNQWAMEAPEGFKYAAVAREIARENWTEGDIQPVTEFEAIASEEGKPTTVSAPKEVVIVREPDESAAMPLMHSANGHTVSVNEN